MKTQSITSQVLHIAAALLFMAITVYAVLNDRYGIAIAFAFAALVAVVASKYEPYNGDKPRRYSNPNIASAMMSNTRPFKEGDNFFLNGVQLQVIETIEKDGDARCMQVETNAKHLPKVRWWMSLPSMLPYGGHEYAKNEDTMRKVFSLHINHGREVEMVKNAAVEVANAVGVTEAKLRNTLKEDGKNPNA